MDINVTRSRIIEEARGVDERVGGLGNRLGSAKAVDRVGEGVNGVRVVEGLGTEDGEQGSVAGEGRAVVNVGIGLDNPDELLNGVVEVELDLVRR